MSELRVNVDNPSTNPVNVTGSITTSPSGTQNVAVTGQPVTVLAVKDPAIDGAYVFSADEIVGIVAATNYLSIFNPAGSGKTIFFAGAFLSASTAGGSAVTAPMRAYRATAISGGVLQADSASAKFVTSYPDPVAEIRTGNPTATLDGAIFNSPPPLSAGSGSTGIHPVIAIASGVGTFLLAEGEGVVLRQTTGDVDLRWNLSIVWAEA